MTDIPVDPDWSRAATLSRTLVAAGHHGPLLIVADNAMIGRRSRIWADAFNGRGWVHRVRLSEGGDDPAEITALVREADGLGATAIIGSGGTSTRSAAARAAARAGLPFFPDMPDASDDDTSGTGGPGHGRAPCGPEPHD
jgi:hypothetical protein